MLEELPDLPYLPELPHRGPGADLIGRSALFLTDLHVDLQPAGWRLVSRPGHDERRGRDLLERDLDSFEEAAHDYVGPVKVQVAGPWTLAASLELTRGDKALADEGAVRDLSESLADGVAGHVADMRKRLPNASIIVAFDEPSLPAVVAGHIPTASGFSTLPRPEGWFAEQRLSTVLTGISAPAGVHCCAENPPITLVRKAGAAFVSLDFTLPFSVATMDEFGEAVEAGVGVIAGLVGTGGSGAGRQSGILSDVGRTVEPILSLWRRLGLAAEQLREVAVSPTCGLAGASPQAAIAAMRMCREAGNRLAEGDL
ncbi:MAG TPA: methionine synthase [Frankiaceae bacterium]|nr:methionine synthase [Frankiaceae bacterium]